MHRAVHGVHLSHLPLLAFHPSGVPGTHTDNFHCQQEDQDQKCRDTPGGLGLEDIDDHGQVREYLDRGERPRGHGGLVLPTLDIILSEGVEHAANDQGEGEHEDGVDIGQREAEHYRDHREGGPVCDLHLRRGGLPRLPKLDALVTYEPLWLAPVIDDHVAWTPRYDDLGVWTIRRRAWRPSWRPSHVGHPLSSLLSICLLMNVEVPSSIVIIQFYVFINK